MCLRVWTGLSSGKAKQHFGGDEPFAEETPTKGVSLLARTISGCSWSQWSVPSFEGASGFGIQALYGVLIREIPFLPGQGGEGAPALAVLGSCLPCTPGGIVLICTALSHEEAEGAARLSWGEERRAELFSRQEFTGTFS